MSAVKTEARPYLDAFRDDATEPSWLRDARQEALRTFGARGFPSRREEAWRFTNLRPLAETFFPPSFPPPNPPPQGGRAIQSKFPSPFTGEGGVGVTFPTYRLVFANGIAHSPPGDLPKGVWLGPLSRAIAERPEIAKRAIGASDLAGGQPFAALNAALFRDGFVLALDADVTLDRPVEIVHVTRCAEPTSLHRRNLVVLGPGSAATLIETSAGAGPYWTNAVSALAVGDGAALDHINLQDEAQTALWVNLQRADLAKSAKYRHFSLTLGAGLSRNDLLVNLLEKAKVDVVGAYLQRGDQDTTHVIAIDHAAPGATTRELWKGVLDERAHGAFLGSIRVRPEAQQTDAQQVSRALLLSDRAAVDTKPELEILADDVKCSHGAAVGALDPDALFYLRARGIALDEARRLLVEAFVLEAIDRVERPELREHLARHVHCWLSFETHASRAPQDEVELQEKNLSLRSGRRPRHEGAREDDHA